MSRPYRVFLRQRSAVSFTFGQSRSSHRSDATADCQTERVRNLFPLSDFEEWDPSRIFPDDPQQLATGSPRPEPLFLQDGTPSESSQATAPPSSPDENKFVAMRISPGDKTSSVSLDVDEPPLNDGLGQEECQAVDKLPGQSCTQSGDRYWFQVPMRC